MGTLRYETRQVRGASSLLLELSFDAEMELEIAASLAEHTRRTVGPLVAGKWHAGAGETDGTFTRRRS